MTCKKEIYEYQISKFHSIIGNIELYDIYLDLVQLKSNQNYDYDTINSLYLPFYNK